MILDWIQIGEVSAERDSNLSYYFFDAGVSASIVKNKKQYLLLGRKGAGKTAVYLHLLQKPLAVFELSDIVIGLSLQSYNWNAHHLLSNDSRAGGFQHRDSWRFVLFVETIRAIVEFFNETHRELPRGIKNASKTLERVFNGSIPCWTDLLGKKLFSLASFKLPELGVDEDGFTANAGEISFEDITANSSLRDQLNSNIEALTVWLERSLESIPTDTRVFLVFDRLDEGWVANFVTQSKSIIAGLLHASEHVLHKFDGRIRPLVFLREDIFSTFDINDKNKLREDCSQSLRWSQEDIERLALTRVNFYAKSSGVAPMDTLQDIFHEKEMRSRTTPIKHIYNRTMGRPRDMVAFLSKTFKAAKTDNLYNLESDKIITKAIYNAEPSYSDYLYEELIDEWNTQNPQFRAYLAELENLRYAAVSSGELQETLVKKNLVQDWSGFRDVVRFLFENSIIGITVGESRQWRYRCFYPNQAFVDATVIKTHPGLIKRLGLIEGGTEKANSTGTDMSAE